MSPTTENPDGPKVGDRVHNRHVATWDGPQYLADLVACDDPECGFSHAVIGMTQVGLS